MANPRGVAVDLDDVVLDFLGGLVTSVNIEHGTDLKVDDITDWNLHPFLDRIIGRSFWDWLEDRDWIWSNFPAVPGAMGGLSALRRAGFYIECVTSKPDWAEYNVWKWLGKWRPPFNRVTIVGQHDRKVDFSDALYLVDDKPQNCIEWADEGRIALLFDQPHNRRPQTQHLPYNGGRIERVMNWDEVVDRILNGPDYNK